MTSILNSIPASFWLHNKNEINKWISKKYGETPPPLYCSVDMRNSGFKIAHVDANLFPAGFNNLHTLHTDAVADKFHNYLQHYFPQARKILLLHENFTRNDNYLKNVSMLVKLLSNNNIECRAEPIDNVVNANNAWQADLVILNSDLSTGIPPALFLLPQPIIPNPALGWHARSKYRHFLAFNQIILEFAANFKLDSWLLSTYVNFCAGVDFKHKVGLDNLAEKVENVISLSREKYAQYSISQEPYVFVKADHGTFGAGIMTAKSGDDIIQINKKLRHTMQTINHGISNTDVLIQEGVPSSLTINDGAAEYAYYIIGGETKFRMIRHNPLKNHLSNLNSRGMEMIADMYMPYDAEYVIASLATLATTFEPTS